MGRRRLDRPGGDTLRQRRPQWRLQEGTAAHIPPVRWIPESSTGGERGSPPDLRVFRDHAPGPVRGAGSERRCVRRGGPTCGPVRPVSRPSEAEVEEQYVKSATSGFTSNMTMRGQLCQVSLKPTAYGRPV